MASETRIQGRSRVAKKVIGRASYDLNGGIMGNQVGRKPRTDKHGFPAYKGMPFPVLVHLDIVDTTP